MSQTMRTAIPRAQAQAPTGASDSVWGDTVGVFRKEADVADTVAGAWVRRMGPRCADRAGGQAMPPTGGASPAEGASPPGDRGTTGGCGTTG
jgi:hypothetical protein